MQFCGTTPPPPPPISWLWMTKWAPPQAVHFLQYLAVVYQDTVHFLYVIIWCLFDWIWIPTDSSLPMSIWLDLDTYRFFSPHVYLTGFGYLQILLSPCLFDWIWIPTDSSLPMSIWLDLDTYRFFSPHVYLTRFGYLQILLSPCLFDWIWIPTDSSPPLEVT